MNEVPTIFDEVENSGKEVVIERHGKLFSIRPKRATKSRGRRHFSSDDSLFGLIGLGASGQQDVSTQKHQYHADAIAIPHDGSEPMQPDKHNNTGSHHST